MFKRAHTYLFLLMLATANIKAQTNLVYNGDFEIYDSCPKHESYAGIYPLEIEHCLGWTAPTYGSSDYFNTCAYNSNPFVSSNHVSVPYNAVGFQNAYHGNGYLGGFLYSIDGGAGNYSGIEWWEYIQGQLIQPLISNHKYELTFYVSLAEQSEFAITRIGAYFSNTAITSSSTQNLVVIPQVESTPGVYYKDTVNWQQVKGTFTANGGEVFITIGNFRDSITTDTLRIQTFAPDFPNTYYYIDSVSLRDITPVFSLAVPNIFTPNQDQINDVFQINYSGVKSIDLIIYDRWGLKIFETSEIDNFWDGRTTSGIECNDGIYYYIINVEDIEDKKHNSKGYIQLIH